MSLAAVVRAEQVRFVPKASSRLMRVLAWLLRWVGNDRFMTHQWTTVMGTIYTPAGVPDLESLVYGSALLGPAEGGLSPFADVIAHELQHVRDSRRWPLLFQLSYLLLPLPVGLAFFRVYWEAKAYAINIVMRPARYTIESVTQSLWSGYAWPMPRPWIRAVLRWHVRRLRHEQ